MRTDNLLRSIGFVLFVVSVAFATACSQSAEARRKEAQANADKYMEFLKANDAAGAYRSTFSEQYQNEQSLDSWLRFRQGMSNVTGPIVNYQVVKYDAAPENPVVSLTYAVQTANLQEPVIEVVKLQRVGTEWKIMSVEPQLGAMKTPPPSRGATPPVQGPGGPRPGAPQAQQAPQAPAPAKP